MNGESRVPDHILKAVVYFAGSASGPLFASWAFVRSAWGDIGTALIAVALFNFGMLSGFAYLAHSAKLFRSAHGMFGIFSCASGVFVVLHAVQRNIPWVILMGVMLFVPGIMSILAAYEGKYRVPGAPAVDFRREVSADK